jgi:hypothetical protein
MSWRCVQMKLLLYYVIMLMNMMIMFMGWDYVFELQLPAVHLLGHIRAWRTVVEWYKQGKTPDLSTRALWQFYQQDHLIANQEELCKKLMNLAFTVSFYVLKVVFIYHKIVWHRANGFTSPMKEDMLWIFIAHKNPLPQPGLNPQTLGPVASTLTARPPRLLCDNVNLSFFQKGTFRVMVLCGLL